MNSGRNRKPIESRGYQLRTVDNIVHWSDLPHVREGLIAMGCGLGKTVIAALAIERLLKRDPTFKSLWLIDRDVLVFQAHRELNSILGIPVGMEKANFRAAGESVVVASLQSLYAERLAGFAQQFEPDLIICDEAHLGNGKLLQDIKRAFPNAKILNLTGTPFVNSVYHRMDLGMVLGAMTIDQGVDEGVIVPPILIGQLPVDLSKAKISDGDYSERSLSEILLQPDNLQKTLAFLAPNLPNQKSLIFAASVKHGKILANNLRKQGFNIGEVYDSTTEEERSTHFSDLQRGRIHAIVNNLVLPKGFDLPAITQVINLRPTKKPELAVQIISRGIRRDKDNAKKEVCRLLDIRNTGEMPKSDIPLPSKEDLELVSVMRQAPQSTAAYVASFLYQQDDLKEHLALAKGRRLMDPESLHEAFYGRKLTGEVAQAEKAQLAKILQSPEDFDSDTSLKQMLRIFRCQHLEEFLLQLHENGWHYFPREALPISQEQLDSSLQSQHELLASQRKDYNFEEFMREISLDRLLNRDNPPKVVDTFTDRRHQMHWYRPWKPTEVPYWIAPLGKNYAVRMDTGGIQFKMYNPETKTLQPFTPRDWSSLPIYGQLANQRVVLTDEMIHANGLPETARGGTIDTTALEAFSLQRELEQHAHEIHKQVANEWKREIASPILSV